MTAPTLRIRDLTLGFRTYAGMVEVLHGISLNIGKGERVALVGESGSGKSVTARIILGLLQSLKSARVAGLVEFEGRDLKTLSERERHGTARHPHVDDLPGPDIVAQSGLSDRRRSSTRSCSAACPASRKPRRAPRAVAALDDVAIDEPERVLDSYSFQLSGGMNQRVMIAMALVNEPSLLIADEPGTALDVTVQAQTLGLMRDLVEKHHTAVLFISHNLGVVREFADRVYVIYKGRIVEHGSAASLFDDPQHPYTRALLTAVPRITGGGIPEIEDASEDYFAPLVVHDGFGEPEGSEMDASAALAPLGLARSSASGSRQVRAVDDVSFEVARRRVPGDRRRIRVRQVDDRQHDPRHLPADPRRDCLPRQRAAGKPRPRASPLDPARAAEPAVLAQPQAQRRRIAQAGARRARHRRENAAPSGRGSCSRRSTCRRHFARARPRRSPAASASASRLPVRWPASRSWSCSTSRHRRSTCWSRRAC